MEEVKKAIDNLVTTTVNECLPSELIFHSQGQDYVDGFNDCIKNITDKISKLLQQEY